MNAFRLCIATLVLLLLPQQLAAYDFMVDGLCYNRNSDGTSVTMTYQTELKRILLTQKAITTEADNALGEPVQLRLCSDPTDSAAEIYCALGYNPVPFKRYTIKVPSPPPDGKICSTHDKIPKNETTTAQPNSDKLPLKLG